MRCLVLCWIALLALCFAWIGCGGDPISPETEALSDFMSIANVRREAIHNAAGDIVGVDLSAEVVNTGPVPIISPFILTWRLRGSDRGEIARATHWFSGFGAGEVRGIVLTMTFAPRANLAGVQDVVTFDFEEKSQ